MLFRHVRHHSLCRFRIRPAMPRGVVSAAAVAPSLPSWSFLLGSTLLNQSCNFSTMLTNEVRCLQGLPGHGCWPHDCISTRESTCQVVASWWRVEGVFPSVCHVALTGHVGPKNSPLGDEHVHQTSPKSRCKQHRPLPQKNRSGRGTPNAVWRQLHLCVPQRVPDKVGRRAQRGHFQGGCCLWNCSIYRWHFGFPENASRLALCRRDWYGLATQVGRCLCRVPKCLLDVKHHTHRGRGMALRTTFGFGLFRNNPNSNSNDFLGWWWVAGLKWCRNRIIIVPE